MNAEHVLWDVPPSEGKKVFWFQRSVSSPFLQTFLNMLSHNMYVCHWFALQAIVPMEYYGLVLALRSFMYALFQNIYVIKIAVSCACTYDTFLYSNNVCISILHPICMPIYTHLTPLNTQNTLNVLLFCVLQILSYRVQKHLMAAANPENGTFSRTP